jgi:hypothetical protein
MSAVWLLIDLLAGRTAAHDVTPDQWPSLFAIAKAEAMMGTLAEIVGANAAHDGARALLADQRAANVQARRQAMWEAEMAHRALDPAGVRFALMKGAAYAAANLSIASGRQIGDLDILVAESDLDRAEAALIAAGWEWVKADAYDDHYYRTWMHELPPLIHKDRDRMIDVHHDILPRTHRARTDAASMLALAQATGDDFLILTPADRLIHCAAHCMADGDLQGGLRNLYDFHGLYRDYLVEGGDACALIVAARHHGLHREVARAIRLSTRLYAPADSAPRLTIADHLFLRRLIARDDLGRETGKLLGFAFYVRSHLLRMPLQMLVRHLWTKWRR